MIFLKWFSIVFFTFDLIILLFICLFVLFLIFLSSSCVWSDFLCLSRVKCIGLLISMSVCSDISFHMNLTFTAAVLSFTCVTSGKYPQTQCVFQWHPMRVNTVSSPLFSPLFTLSLVWASYYASVLKSSCQQLIKESLWLCLKDVKSMFALLG